MNELPSQQARSNRGCRRWLLIVIALPILLGAIAVAVLAWTEYRNRREFVAEIERLRAAGQPVDNETLASWFWQNTSQEGTAAWREILVQVEQITTSNSAIHGLPIIGHGELPDDLAPGDDWPDEPRIAAFLEEAQPLIAKIEDAARYPTPVWQPIAFDGFGTLLSEVQASRGIIRVVQLEFLHALYHEDTQRITRSLGAMPATAASFDWDVCLVSDLVGIALRGVHRNSIRRSLSHTAWQPADLDGLLDQVAQPRDFVTRWQRTTAGERAMALAVLRGDRQRLEHLGVATGRPGDSLPAWMLMSSFTRRYLQTMEAVQQLGDQGIEGLVERADEFERREFPSERFRFDDILSHLLLPSVRSWAAAQERDEHDRRLTRTAVGLKRFHMVEGRWPEKLDDLATMGLNTRDWTALQAGPFGYRIEDDQAVLWGYESARTDRPARIPDEPPDGDASWQVVRIPP
jgi:hypothetical protein